MVLLTIAFPSASPSWLFGHAWGGFTRFRGTTLLMTASSLRSKSPSVPGRPSGIVGERALSTVLSFRVAGLEFVAAELFRVTIVQPAVDREELEAERANRSFRAV